MSIELIGKPVRATTWKHVIRSLHYFVMKSTSSLEQILKFDLVILN